MEKNDGQTVDEIIGSIQKIKNIDIETKKNIEICIRAMVKISEWAEVAPHVKRDAGDLVKRAATLLEECLNLEIIKDNLKKIEDGWKFVPVKTGNFFNNKIYIWKLLWYIKIILFGR